MKTETPLFSSLHRRRGLYMFSMILLLTFIESNFYLIVFFVVALFPPTPPSANMYVCRPLPFSYQSRGRGLLLSFTTGFASLHHDYACTLLLLNSRFSALSFSSSPFISPQSYTFIPPSQITFIYGSSLSLSSKVSSSKSPGGLLLIATGFPPSY